MDKVSTKIIKTVNSNPIQSDFHETIKGIKYVAEFVQFAHWMSTPIQFREPEFQRDFAVQIGVSEDTLTDWKKHPKFWPLVQSLISVWIKERIPDVVGGLYENVLKVGNAKEVELYLRLAGIQISKDNKKGK